MSNSKKSRSPEAEGQKSAPDVLEGFIEEAEWARQGKRSKRTCQRHRALGIAPPHIIVGRTVYYRIEAVRQWLISREQQPTRRLPKQKFRS